MIRQLRGSLVWYAFIAPTFLLFGLFVVYPTIETFRLSFFREVATRQEFVGATHYLRLLTNQIFLNALLNTAALGIAFLVIAIPLALILASLLNHLRYAPKLFKAIYFLPQVTSTVAGTLHGLGVTELPLWLADPHPSLTGSRAAVTLLAVWVALGYYMLIFLAGLQAIPAQLYDAAVVDGASPLRAWWYITIPSLRPTFVFLILTGTIDAMSRFSDTWMLGGPGGTPARSLQTIVMYIYQTAFESSDFNLASAAAVILFLIVLALTLINFRIFLHRDFAQR